MLYQEASRILQDVEEKKASVKTLVMRSKFENKKPLLALTCETLKYTSILNGILERTKLLKLEKSIKTCHLGRCLLYDFLIGKGLKSAGNYKQAILKHKAALKSELERLKVKAKVTKAQDLISSSSEIQLPRYVRVNLLKTSVADVIEHFSRMDKYTLRQSSRVDYNRYIDEVKELQGKQFTQDICMKELLVFPTGTDLHDHILYERGDIILQDKASCLPAFVLNPPSGSHVIDCCAAPGNKTTCVAAIMKNKGKIFSFDLDSKRLATMNTMTLKAGVLCSKLLNQDFLKVNPHDPSYSQVEYIIVDPSCSGSGIVSRLNQLTDDKTSSSKERLEGLASFQVSILKHALTFPKAKRVVYSTCSIHKEENENVVWEVLQQVQDDFGLEHILPEFPNRGIQGIFPYSERCVRMASDKDLTNGFFVACFQKGLKMAALDKNINIGDSENGEKDSLPSEPESIVGMIASVGEINTIKNLVEKHENRANIEENKKSKRRKRKKKKNKEISSCQTLSSGCSNKSGINAEILGKRQKSEEFPNREMPTLKKKRKQNQSVESSFDLGKIEKVGKDNENLNTESSVANLGIGFKMSDGKIKKKNKKRNIKHKPITN